VDVRLMPNPQGGYQFLPGVPYVSSAARAADGFEVVRASFRRPRRLFPEGLADVESHLRSLGRPVQALCGLELRFGRQATLEEFDAFNKVYIDRMSKAGLLIDDRAPIARTNVAVPGSPAEHQIHAFSYTVPVSRPELQPPPTFVVAATPEVLPPGGPPGVAAPYDTSPEGLRQKTAVILETLGSRLAALGARWSDVTGVQLYTVHNLHELLSTMVRPALGEAGGRGIEWHFAQPPVVGLEIELDARSTRMELTVDT